MTNLRRSHRRRLCSFLADVLAGVRPSRKHTMKFGCCGNLVARGDDRTGIEIVEAVASSGYDYIELPIAEMCALSDEQFGALRMRVEAAGIPCEVCNNFFPPYMPITGPDAKLAELLEYVEFALTRAASLGARVVVLGSGASRNVPAGFSFLKAYEQLFELCRAIAPIADRHGITIAIEPLRKPECNIINTFEDGVLLAKQVSHPRIRVLVDYFHLAWEEEPVAHIAKYGKEFLAHVHLANPNLLSEVGRIYPASMDEWDYAPFIEALRAADYEGRVSIEAGSSNVAHDIRQAIAFLRSSFDVRPHGHAMA
ncbi:MAG: sugar phosphate isomerase/epimerase family protein [Rhodocyclaceae bacterium]